MSDNGRARKLAERIGVIVAETLELKIKDPRLGFITITDTRITNDLREATVFYTVFGDEASKAGTAAALESAKGVLRSEVGRQTGVRYTPSLAFFADAVPENAAHIDDLLRAAKAADAQVHEIAAGAEYAGEADPYRAPRDSDDDESDDDESDDDEDDDDEDDDEDDDDEDETPSTERA